MSNPFLVDTEIRHDPKEKITSELEAAGYNNVHSIMTRKKMTRKKMTPIKRQEKKWHDKKKNDPNKIIHVHDEKPYDKNTIIEHTKKDAIVAHNREEMNSAWEKIKSELEAAGCTNVHSRMKCTYS